MQESEFNQLAEATMAAIEEAVEQSEAEIDYDTISDILTLEFENGSKIIINKQTPLCQLWVATKLGGFHFDYVAESADWCLDKDHSRHLFSCLNEYCSVQAGETVELLQPDT